MGLRKCYALICDVAGCMEELLLRWHTSARFVAAEALLKDWGVRGKRWYCPAHWAQLQELQANMDAMRGREGATGSVAAEEVDCGSD